MSQRIEGLPPGTRIKAVRMMQDCTSGAAHVELEPDNVYAAMDILCAVAVPEGYERAGDKPEEWFRAPMKGDLYLRSGGVVMQSDCDIKNGITLTDCDTDDVRRIILRKVNRTRYVLVAEWDDCSIDVFDSDQREFNRIVPPTRHRIEARLPTFAWLDKINERTS